MAHAIEPDSKTLPKPRLVDAYDVKRRPRPPGSSWLLDPDLNLATLRWNQVVQRSRLISDAKRPADAPVRSRKAFTNEQRKAVCEMAAGTKLSNEELANMFETNRSTIARTLKHAKTWLRFDKSANDAKVARNRGSPYVLIEALLAPWTWECEREGVFITDAMLKAKAMELAKKHHMLDTSRPFACSPKWLRKVKARLHIVNPKETLPQSRDELSGSSSPELRVSPLPEPSEDSPEIFSSTRASGITTSSASSNPPSPISFRSAIEAPHADTDALLPAFPPTFAPSCVPGSTDSFAIWVQDTSSLSTVEHAPSGLSHQTPSPRSSPKLYTPDWLHTPELVAPADHYEKYDEMHDAPSSELGSTSRLDMDTPFLLTDGLISGAPTLPVMQASIPPPVADGYIGHVPFTPLDYIFGIIPTDGVPADAAPFFSPFPDPLAPSSFIWPTNASPALASSVDFSAPSMSPTDSLGILVPQPVCVPQEDIDRLAAEMMHWPIETLLGDMPMSQSHAAYPCGEVSFGAPTLSNWPCTSFDGLGNTGFVPA